MAIEEAGAIILNMTFTVWIDKRFFPHRHEGAQVWVLKD